MSVMVNTVGRRPAIFSGLIGLVVGLAFGITLAWAVMSAADRPVEAGIQGGAALSNVQLSQALRQHAVREYGAVAAVAPTSASTFAQQRQHLLREYGAAAAPSTGGWYVEQSRHLAREYRAGVGAAQAGDSLAERLFQHTIRENGNP